MLIYTCALDFDSSTRLNDLLSPIARWFGLKLETWVDSTSLLHDYEFSRHGSRLEVVASTDDLPQLVHACLAHPDRDIHGREWRTEIGIRYGKDSTPTRITVLLRLEDASVEIASDYPVTVTRPAIVTDLLRDISTACQAPGQAPRWLLPEQWPSALKEAERQDRDHPIFILSPRDDGTYSVDHAALLWQVGGLADVWVIPPGTNTWEMERLYPVLAAWRGAVKILWPPSPRLPYVPFKVFLQQDLDLMAGDGRVENQLLTKLLTSWVNRRNQLQHVTAADVRRLQLERLVDQMQRETGVSEATRQVLAKQSQMIDSLQDELETLRRDITEALDLAAKEEDHARSAEQEARELQHDADVLKLQLNRAGMSIQGTSDNEINDAVGKTIAGRATLTDALRLLAGLWPERILVLDSAWESAEDARNFERVAAASELLWQLATGFWEGLTTGLSIEQAGQVFGAAFAASESETVKKNPRAREARSFMVDGQSRLMLPHLRIGIKDSVARTWRCHFDWDVPRQQIIIGWCGRHLPHR